jgi:hypothetical protein
MTKEESYARMATDRYGPVQHVSDSWWGWLRRKRRDPQGVDLRGWIDHPECRKTADGRRYFISQPYVLTAEDIRALADLCEAEQLKCEIHGGSWHFPGWTVAIVLQTEEQHRLEHQSRVPESVAD